MKNLILAVFTFVSIQAQADVIATYQFGIRDYTQQNSTPQVFTADLTDEGTLNVSVMDLVFSGGDLNTLSEPMASKKLHPLNFQNLLYKIQRLSNLAVNERFNLVVCEIAVSIEMGYNHLSVARNYDHSSLSFMAPLQVVHGPQGCWVGHSISLQEEYGNQIAAELKNSIQALALELITL